MRPLRIRTADRDEPRRGSPTMMKDELAARRQSEVTTGQMGQRRQRPPSFKDVLRSGGFRYLWIAQIFSQLAQNLTWLTLGAYVAQVATSGKNTAVAAVTVSAMFAQLFLSGFAGVIVDRVSKRHVLLRSNVLRVGLMGLLIVATRLNPAIQPPAIILLVFIINAIAQFFTPAEASTIPLVVERRSLIAATSLFNITLNACIVLPIILGLLVLEWLGIVRVLVLIAIFYALAALLVSRLPNDPAPRRRHPVSSSLPEAGRHVIGDLIEALRFLAHDPGLRLTLFLVNVAPAFLFVFGTLGLNFVSETFGINQAGAWRLLLPAGIGLIIGAAVVGRVAAHRRQEDVINASLLVMGVAVTILGSVAVIFNALYRGAGRVGDYLSSHVHQLPEGHNIGLIPPAMILAFVIGLAMAMATIPAQTLVLERTSENVRGRVLALQQLVGGAIPIIPLLIAAPLADIFGNSTVMTGLGIVIILVGATSVRLDHGHRRQQQRPHRTPPL